MVGCVLVMAPTGLECTQDMRNGTVAGGGATSPRGGQASHHPRALVLQPTDATSGVDPAAVRPFGWGARGVTGLTREKVRQEREGERKTTSERERDTAKGETRESCFQRLFTHPESAFCHQ